MSASSSRCKGLTWARTWNWWTAGRGAPTWLDVLADRHRVIVVDAMEAGLAPGAILRMKPEELMPADGRGISLHELGLVESLQLTRHLGCEPRNVTIFGVQPRRVAPGLELSEDVAGAVPRVIAAVLASLNEDDS